MESIKPQQLAMQESIDHYQKLSLNHKRYLLELLLQYDCVLQLFDEESESVAQVKHLRVSPQRGESRPLEIYTELKNVKTHCWSSRFKSKPELKMVGRRRIGRPRKVKA
jgi:hypothetical protein